MASNEATWTDNATVTFQVTDVSGTTSNSVTTPVFSTGYVSTSLPAPLDVKDLLVDLECLVCEEPVTGNLLCPICVEGVKLMVKEALKRDLIESLEELNVSEPVARQEEESRQEKASQKSGS